MSTIKKTIIFYEQLSKIHTIRQALIKGEQSGDNTRSVDEIMQSVLTRKNL